MMSKFIKLLHLWLPVILWAFLIFTLSGMQTSKTSDVYWQDFVVKKTAHLIEYGILFSLLFRAIKNTKKLTFTKTVASSLFLLVLYATTDEFHQTFVTTRQGAIMDVLIDTIGGLISLIIVWKYLPKAPKKLKVWAKNLQLI